jgi:Flp pilus assembly protein CpaB
MTAVRYLLRVSMLMLVGVAVFCGLVLLFNAQALLNRHAELYMMDTERSSTAVMNRANAAHHEPALPSTPPVRAETERVPAIHVSGAESLAGVAAADRFVDVILTHQPGTSAAFSEVVLENVKVLTIEPITADGGIGERSTLHAVTLDVDSDAVENLVLASRSGKLSLTLHRPGDHGRPPNGQSGGAEVATTPPIAARDAPPPSGPELAEGPPPSAPEARQANAPEAAGNTPTSAPDDDRFTIVTINRVGGKSSTHRVPRER